MACKVAKGINASTAGRLSVRKYIPDSGGHNLSAKAAGRQAAWLRRLIRELHPSCHPGAELALRGARALKILMHRGELAHKFTSDQLPQLR